MIRIGLIADIHGNLSGLTTALQELDNAAVDRVICLGDVANLGPSPGEVIDLLRDREIPTVIGNADAWLIPERELPVEPADSIATIALTEWTRDHLNAEQLAWLHDLPLSWTEEIEGVRIISCHGSPDSVDQVIAMQTAESAIRKWIDGSEPTVLINGHTHIALDRKIGASRLVNPGSAGLPGVGPDDPLLSRNEQVNWIECAVLQVDRGEVAVEHLRIPIEINTMVNEVADSGMPQQEWWRERWQLT